MKNVINFGSVALSPDPIYGCLVYSEDGWIPFSEGTDEQKEWVKQQVLNSSLKTLLDTTPLECIKKRIFTSDHTFM